MLIFVPFSVVMLCICSLILIHLLLLHSLSRPNFKKNCLRPGKFFYSPFISQYVLLTAWESAFKSSACVPQVPPNSLGNWAREWRRDVYANVLWSGREVIQNLSSRHTERMREETGWSEHCCIHESDWNIGNSVVLFSLSQIKTFENRIIEKSRANKFNSKRMHRMLSWWSIIHASFYLNCEKPWH